MSKGDEFFEQVGTRPATQRGSQNWAVSGVAHRDEPVATPPTPPVIGPGKSWASSGDAFWRIGESHDHIPPGVYRCGNSPSIGPHFIRVKNETDTLIVFPDSESTRIVEEIRRFQGMKEKFSSHGFLHKRGVLMWGPPGSGKTTTLQLLIKLIVDGHGGIAVLVDHPGVAVACLQMLRTVEPDRQLVGVLEDLDALVERHGESEYLALLDGESQVDNVVYVATTNYPERLDARFVDRPSRFDTIRYIGMPSADARRLYLSTKEPSLSGAELDSWVAASEGFSVAHLKEMIIAVECFDQPVKAVVQRLEEMQQRKPTSEDSPDKVGMGLLAGRRTNGAYAQ